jgi:hypothetical protein
MFVKKSRSYFLCRDINKISKKINKRKCNKKKLKIILKNKTKKNNKL